MQIVISYVEKKPLPVQLVPIAPGFLHVTPEESPIPLQHPSKYWNAQMHQHIVKSNHSFSKEQTKYLLVFIIIYLL